ncbi:alkyl/aryl-sulfatase [Aquipseudomonas ullengensis]|uniref:MBL fold metallo-hydrolase n=1 Tax=Aquipseudomonas ullengensis TaxID=2759166 RepID=A0A7W4QBW8_9GAMM|nr:alkyl sulfatase dimerization domain-containing protein [Pseudomonas ullengensis]MBB2497084.1 MBL fold metallo-hydrolase [Pseudomonas ullengensis]
MKPFSLLPLLAFLSTASLSPALLASQPASSITAAKNAEVLKVLPFTDRADYESASRGLIAPFSGQIKNADGQVVWDMDAYKFLDADLAPETVNPSLWRLAQLNKNAGLFQVADNIYQLRGMDVSNMTVIEGDDGLFIIDPLTYSETAKAALELYYQHRPKKPVLAVAYSHSHADHFGGVRGVVDEADVKAGKVKIFAPSGFMEHVVAENVFAGSAMSRRAQFQFGSLLPRGEQGQVDTGMGKTIAVNGGVSVIAPTDLISNPYETHTVSGIEIEFQLTPGTEAPSEMNFYLPKQHALCMSENTTQMMHNVLTPRGALVRDAKAWAEFIDESLERYGNKTDVMFISHNWPIWGGERIRTFLADQRDMYAFLNDRTLNLINKGLTPTEIAEKMDKLPGDLEKKWYTRSYYGSLSHNSRAVYQRYLGYYDGNPANLDPLTPVDAGKHYVQAMGGTEAVLKQMRTAIDQGDYRWATTLGNNLVFADPGNQAAKALQADALEQLGYQSENALWRNIYLTGAMELRNGVPAYNGGAARSDLGRSMTASQFFDYLAVRLDSDKAQGHDMVLNWVFEDIGQSFVLTLRNGVLTHRNDKQSAQAVITVKLDKATLDQISMRRLDFPTAVKRGDIKLEGDGKRLGQFLSMLDTFTQQFNIVTP